MTRLRAGGTATAVVLFAAVLIVLFRGVFPPGEVMFSNDGPLGELMAECHRLPGRFFGCWRDLNNVGFNGGAASPSFSFGLQWLLGPMGFAKFDTLVSLFILGLGAWCFFRQSKLHPWACLLGGLAAFLNSTFFSVACWGMGAHAIAAGMLFFALAAVADPSATQRWLRTILAGMALGMAVTEGADVGAIFCLYAAAFIVYQAWTLDGSVVRRAAISVGRLLLVAACAAFLAAQSIHGLIGTSISGVRGMQQDEQTRMERWNWATQWSLPKLEALNLVVPGLFGYRMNTPEASAYWGVMGRDPAWETYIAGGRQGPPPTGLFRFSGGGNYAGAIVALIACWAAAQSLRRRASLFGPRQRKWIWFWLAVGAVSLLLAFGRFAPFYRLAYALPYVSTIRNPVKFLDLFSLSMVVLFAYGADGLCRQYLQGAAADASSRWRGLGSWWSQASRFDRCWVVVCGVILGLVLLAWWQYAGHRDALVQYLQTDQLVASPAAVGDFSIRQAGWLAVGLGLGLGLLILMFSGFFAGRRAGLGAVCLGLLAAGDLALANNPWIVYWNYPEKYATNVVLDGFQDKPFEHRVAVAPIDKSSPHAILGRLYRDEWLQHEFPDHNIQAFETVEMPRVPEDYGAFMNAAAETSAPGPWFHLARAWQLLAVGNVLAPYNFIDFWSPQPALAPMPLEPLLRFKLLPKPGVTVVRRADQVTAVADPQGAYAVFHYPAALPRASLISRWDVVTNDEDALQELFDPTFDPVTRVIVAGGVPAATAVAGRAAAGSVTIDSYAPKNITLTATAAAPAILLLSDHYDPDWRVVVDGRQQELLRCDALLRGVLVAPGTHRVEFRFLPPNGWFFVSLSALALTVLCLVPVLLPAFRPPAVQAVAAAPPTMGPPLTERRPAGGKRNRTGKDTERARPAKR